MTENWAHSNTLSAIAVDDEPLALDLVREYAEAIPALRLERTFTEASAVPAYLRHEEVDLVFLDIEMPGIPGNALAGVLPERTQVIFTTAFEEYAVEAFERKATDYLVKPIPFDRFVQAVEKALEVSRFDSEGPSGVVTGTGSSLFVKTEYRLERVDLSGILFIEGMRDYLRIHTVREKIMTLMSFAELLERLPERNFVRVHRSYVVSLDHVDAVKGGEIFMHEHVIPIGETYRKSFLQRLSG